MLRIIRLRSTKLASIVSSNSRNFSYQKDIYLNNLNTNDPALRNELNELNKFKIEQSNLYRFIKAYHQHGHKQADINPLYSRPETTLAELDPATYGLTNDTYSTQGLLFVPRSNMNLNEVESYLKSVYSDKMSIEFEHILSEEEKLWISREFEQIQAKQLDKEIKLELAKLLLKSQTLDLFFGLKFPTFKRYSNEGSESSMAFYYSLFANSAQNDIEQLVMGIAHRGRLNLMTCLLNLDPRLMFTKIKGKSEFADEEALSFATGDIVHHFPCSTDLKYNNKSIHVNSMPNPSHLEAVDPLVLGKARSKQMHLRDGMYAEQPALQTKKVSTFLVHGDAAFAGQGIVSETFQAYKLSNYSVGGTVHLITNNQLGFTAPSNLGRYAR